MFKRKIRVIAFDLDHTLYNQDEYYLQVFRRFSIEKNLDVKAFCHSFNKVKKVSKDIFGDVLKDLNIFSTTWQEELFIIYKTIEADISIFENAKSFLSFLSEKGIKRAVITNGVIEAQKNKIKCLKLEAMFDLIIFARTWGKEYEKPHVKPFNFLITQLQCKPEEVLYFGDNPCIDIEGAKNAGMNGELVNSSDDFYPIACRYGIL